MAVDSVGSDPIITSERRCRTQLTAELLRAAEDGANKSTLFRRANLNHTRGTRYLSALVGGGFVQEDDGEFALTAAGRDFLDRWDHIQVVLGEEEPDGSANGSGRDDAPPSHDGNGTGR